MTLLEKLDRLPPIVCRMMAKCDGQFMSDPQIMALTDWGKAKLTRIYNATSWAGISVGDADLFLRACGLSWSSQRRVRWLLRRVGGDISKMRHLQSDKPWRISMVRRHQKRIERLLKREAELVRQSYALDLEDGKI